MIDRDQPLIQTILRYTAEGSEKRNDLQIEQLSFAGRPADPPRFAIAAVLEYQYGRGELRLTSADPHVAAAHRQPLLRRRARLCAACRAASRMPSPSPGSARWRT
jgi:choline dehydrogenase